MKSKNNAIFVNGQLYGWSYCGILIGSNVITVGITSINYKEVTTIENKFGIGQYAIGRGTGQITIEADITLYKEEIQAIQRSAVASGDSLGSISSLSPFDIIMSFGNSDYSRSTTDILKNCQFTENGVSGAIGSTEFVYTIPLVVSHIQWGV